MNTNNCQYFKRIEFEWFTENSQGVIKEYICKLCQGVLNEASMNRNGQLFCHECVEISRREGIEEFVSSEWSPMVFVTNIINNQQCNCKGKPFGCDWVGTFKKMKEHDLICMYSEIKCSFVECEEKILRKDLEAHESVCNCRPAECVLCQAIITFKNLQAHEEECPKKLIYCPQNCQENIVRMNLDYHMKNDCENLIVECEYLKFGCNSNFYKRDTKLHHKEFIGEHNVYFLNFMNEFKETNNKMINQLTLTANEVKEKVIKLEKLAVENKEREKNKEKEKEVVKDNNHKTDKKPKEIKDAKDKIKYTNIMNGLNSSPTIPSSSENSNHNLNSLPTQLLERIRNSIKGVDKNIDQNKNVSDNKEKEKDPSFLTKKTKRTDEKETIPIVPEPTTLTLEESMIIKKDKYFLTKGLLLEGNMITQNDKNSSLEHQFAIIDRKLNNKDNKLNTWKISLINANGWMAFGVCVYEMVSKNNFKFNSSQPLHGMFIVSKSGETWNTNSSWKNNVKVAGFPRDPIKEVLISYEIIKKELKIIADGFEMKIDKVFATQSSFTLMPIVIMKNYGDKILFE